MASLAEIDWDSVISFSSGFGEVVPSDEVDSGIAVGGSEPVLYNRSSGNGTHSELRRSFDVRLSRLGFLIVTVTLWLFHAESA